MKEYQIIIDKEPSFHSKLTILHARFQENKTVPNRLVVRMDGAFGTGIYKCEITIETPVFLTLDVKKNITVIGKNRSVKYLNIYSIHIFFSHHRSFTSLVPPTREPRILGMAQTYQIGNTVEVTCKSIDSKPAPDIQWIVNKKNVSRSQISMPL